MQVAKESPYFTAGFGLMVGTPIFGGDYYLPVVENIVRRTGGSRECNFGTAISATGNFWMTDIRPIGLGTILLMDGTGAHVLSIAYGHVYKA